MKALSPDRGQTILDIGAGRGIVASKVQEVSGADVHALEPDGKLVAKMAADFSKVKGSVGNAERLPFPDAYFEKVYATMALHHFVDLGAALEEVARVLKPGGRFVILEVEPGSARGRLFRLFARLQGERLNLMTRDQLAARVAQAPHFGGARSEGHESGYLVQATRS